MEERDRLVKWLLFTKKEKENPPHSTLSSLLSSGPVRFDIVLFPACETEILQHPPSSYFGIRLEGRTGHVSPKRAKCLEIQRLEGRFADQVFIKSPFYHTASFCSVLSVWSRAAREAPKLKDTWAHEGLKKTHFGPVVKLEAPQERQPRASHNKSKIWDRNIALKSQVTRYQLLPAVK